MMQISEACQLFYKIKIFAVLIPKKNKCLEGHDNKNTDSYGPLSLMKLMVLILHETNVNEIMEGQVVAVTELWLWKDGRTEGQTDGRTHGWTKPET